MPDAKDASTNLYDVLLAVVVCAALVALVVILVGEYGSDTEKIASILGIAAPVLAAGFGISIGYYGGKKAGDASGKEKGKRQVKEQIAPALAVIEQRVDDVLTPAGLEAAAAPASVAELHNALGQLRGLVQAPD